MRRENRHTTIDRIGPEAEGGERPLGRWEVGRDVGGGQQGQQCRQVGFGPQFTGCLERGNPERSIWGMRGLQHRRHRGSETAMAGQFEAGQLTVDLFAAEHRQHRRVRFGPRQTGEAFPGGLGQHPVRVASQFAQDRHKRGVGGHHSDGSQANGSFAGSSGMIQCRDGGITAQAQGLDHQNLALGGGAWAARPQELRSHQDPADRAGQVPG